MGKQWKQWLSLFFWAPRSLQMVIGAMKLKDAYSSGHVWMWELDCGESWAPKNWCFWTVVLEKTLESPLACKEVKPVRPKGDQSWVFIGRTDAEAEAPILWPPDAKSWLIRKDPDAGTDWRQGEKGAIKDELVGWHHRLNGHEFEQAPEMVKDRKTWSSAVYEIAKSQTRLSDWTTKVREVGGERNYLYFI